MTALQPPVTRMLETALATPTGSVHSDISRLRNTLAVALRRCLDAEPMATWPQLVSLAARRGAWDDWRIAGLLAAEDPAGDATTESTRDALAELADELIHRLEVLPEPWEGAERQDAVTSPHWQEGRRRRELVFTIERAMDALVRGDADTLALTAEAAHERDPNSESYPGLADALRGCARDLLDTGSIGAPRSDDLRTALGGTPFVAFVDQAEDSTRHL